MSDVNIIELSQKITEKRREIWELRRQYQRPFNPGAEEIRKKNALISVKIKAHEDELFRLLDQRQLYEETHND